MSGRETSGPEPILFVQTGAPVKAGEFWMSLSRLDFSLVPKDEPEHPSLKGWPGYRRAPPGWLAEAVERLGTMMASCKGSPFMGYDNAQIRAAILGPAPDEPEEWEKEAARDFFERDMNHNSPEALARHFAAARRRAPR